MTGRVMLLVAIGRLAVVLVDFAIVSDAFVGRARLRVVECAHLERGARISVRIYQIWTPSSSASNCKFE